MNVRDRARALLRRRRARGEEPAEIDFLEPPAPPTPVSFVVFEPSPNGPRATGDVHAVEYGEDGRYRMAHRREEPT